MDSRQRVELALSHQQPDRVPIDYWATGEVTSRLMDRLGLDTLEAVLRHFDVDFRYIEGPRYVGPEPRTRPDGSVEDHWGVPRVTVEVEAGGAYREVTASPLEGAADLAEVRDYPHWPSPDWFDYAPVRRQVERVHAAGKVAVFMGDRMNRCAQLKPAMYLRGVARILEDLVLAPDVAEYLFARIAEFYTEYARRTLAAADGGIDLFFTGDDFGTQNGPFMSPDMWRRFLRDGFKAFVDIGHAFGCRVAHHSCGSVKALIPDLIDCGLDVLNPLQPDVRDMDHAEIKRLHGDRLSFHGSISIQKTLPFGRPADIRREVRSRFDALAASGGFIFCTAHNLQPDTPLENIDALFEAYHALGAYG